MNSSKTIEITVNNKGEALVQTRGFSGPSCRDASKFVEGALGVVQTDAPTAEMFQPAQTTPQRVEQRQ